MSVPSCRLAFAEQRLRFLAGLRRAAAPTGDHREPPCDGPLPLHIPGGPAFEISSISGKIPGGGAAGLQPGSRGTPTPAEAVLAGEVARLARERALLLHRLEARSEPYHTPVASAEYGAACALL